MAGRNITNPTTYGTLPASPPPSNANLFDGSFSPLYGVVTDSGNWSNYGTDTGVVNAYSTTLSPAATSYQPGMIVGFTPANTNTGASTLNVNGLGSKAIVNRANITLSGGELVVSKTVVFQYDGTVFRILTPCALNYVQNSSPGTFTLECAGYDFVSVRVALQASNIALTLGHLAGGVPVNIRFFTSATPTYSINATDPTGAAYSIVDAWLGTSAQGSASSNLTSAITMSSGATVNYVGISVWNGQANSGVINFS